MRTYRTAMHFYQFLNQHKANPEPSMLAFIRIRDLCKSIKNFLYVFWSYANSIIANLYQNYFLVVISGIFFQLGSNVYSPAGICKFCCIIQYVDKYLGKPS